MELRSRNLAEVEVGDPDPGVPGPSPLVTEESGEPVPDPGPTLSSISDVAGASTSHPGTAELMGVTLRTSLSFPRCSERLAPLITRCICRM